MVSNKFFVVFLYFLLFFQLLGLAAISQDSLDSHDLQDSKVLEDLDQIEDSQSIDEIVISLRQLLIYKYTQQIAKSLKDSGIFSLYLDNSLIIYTRVGKLLRIKVDGYDPDNDDVKVIFLTPLNSDGTFYVSREGTYFTKILLYDGKEITETDVKIIALPIRKYPSIFAPEPQVFEEGKTAKLEFTYSPKDAKVKLSGFFDTLEKELDYNSSGDHFTKITVCTDVCVEKNIRVIVKEVNQKPKIIKLRDTILVDYYMTLQDLEKEILESYQIIDDDFDDIISFVEIPKNLRRNFNLEKLPNTIKYILRVSDGKDVIEQEDFINIVLDEKIKKLFSYERYTIFENEIFYYNLSLPRNVFLKEILTNLNLELNFDDKQTYYIKFLPKHNFVNHKFLIPFIRPNRNERVKLIFEVNNKTFTKIIDFLVLDVNQLPRIEERQFFKEGDLFYFIATDEDEEDRARLRGKLISINGPCNLKYFRKIPFFCAGYYDAVIEISDGVDVVLYNLSFEVVSSSFKAIKPVSFTVMENQTKVIDLRRILSFYSDSLRIDVLDVVDNTGTSLKDYTIFIENLSLFFTPSFDMLNDSKEVRIVMEFVNGNVSWREYLPVKVINVNRKPQFDLKVSRRIFPDNRKEITIEVISWDEDNDPTEVIIYVNNKKVLGNKVNVIYTNQIPTIEVLVSDGKATVRRKVRII